MKKIVFMGAKEIGLLCFRELLFKHLNEECEIIGVLTRSTKLDGKQSIEELCNLHNINLLSSLDDYLTLQSVDITISVQHNEILKKDHIQKASEIAVNLHLAPLPEYRGCNQFSFAIIDAAKWFGATIHEINEGVDSGDILFENRFLIDDKDYWVYELYDKTVIEGAKLFSNSIHKLIKGEYKRQPQIELVEERGTSIHYRKEINTIKKIDLSWDEDKISRHIRGTYMPGFSPPFTNIGGERVNFKIEK